MQEERPGEGFSDEYAMAETVPYIPYETSSSPQAPEAESAPAAGGQDTFVSPYEQERAAMLAASEPKKSRRRRWLVAGMAALLVVLLASVASFFLINYINRPTPNKTLDVFCNALQHEDYRTAYSQFSPGMQSSFPEADFAALLSQDKVTLCTHGNTDDSKSSVTTNLKLVHASKGINADVVTLTKDKNNNWKISDIGRQQ